MVRDVWEWDGGWMEKLICGRRLLRYVRYVIDDRERMRKVYPGKVGRISRLP